MKEQITFLIIASEFKGVDFIKACKKEGCRVFLVMSKFLENEPWPKDHIDELFFVEAGKDQKWDMPDVIAGMAHVMRGNKIDRIVAMDDFDVEKAAELREHFRIPGMGQTTFRHFRDKLAMRIKAADGGIAVPAFSGLFNDAEIEAYCDSVAAPWVVKPRFMASATGIKKINSKEELYQHFEVLGEDRHNYLIEQFRPGDVYHADSLSFRGKQVFTSVCQYLDTPMEVAHGGGIFRTHTIKPNSPEDKAIRKLNADVMECFGMQDSASHTEFIQDKETGEFIFLETASRVGGANIAEMTEAAYGINMWAEWARIEVAVAKQEKYKVPKKSKAYAGIVVSLANELRPDYSGYDDTELVWTMEKDHHIGMIVKSPKRERVLELLDNYAQRIAGGVHASMPAK